MDTRYAPVRRSPAKVASYLPAAPRLACVKPVASVHPEPGSNSSLYILSFSFLCEKRNEMILGLRKLLDVFLFALFRRPVYTMIHIMRTGRRAAFCLWQYVNELSAF